MASWLTLNNVLEAAEEAMKEILNIPLTGAPGKPFEEVEELRAIVGQHRYHRKKKNAGVIGGAAAGIVGTGLSIAGFALIPFTFGASIGLIAAGAAVGVTAGAVNIGFSVDKMFGDKQRLASFQVFCDGYSEFMTNVVVAMGKIHILKKATDELKQIDLDLLHAKLFPAAQEIGSHIVALVKEIREERKNDDSLLAKVQEIRQFTDKLSDEIENLVRCTLTKNARDAFIGRLQSLETLDFVQEAVPLPDGNGFNFRNFVNELSVQDATADPDTNKMEEQESKSGLKVDGKNITRDGRAITTEVQVGRNVFKGVRLLNVADDAAAAAGGVAAKVAKIPVGGIVLGAFAIAFDLGQIGYAIHDLVQVGKEEAEPPQCAGDGFIQGIAALADAMDVINGTFDSFGSSK